MAVIEELAALGMDMLAKDDGGRSAMHAAAAEGQAEALSVLHRLVGQHDITKSHWHVHCWQETCHCWQETNDILEGRCV